jgi:nitrous oxide reductase
MGEEVVAHMEEEVVVHTEEEVVVHMEEVVEVVHTEEEVVVHMEEVVEVVHTVEEEVAHMVVVVVLVGAAAAAEVVKVGSLVFWCSYTFLLSYSCSRCYPYSLLLLYYYLHAFATVFFQLLF